MDPVERLADHWLVCDAYRAKALIKYEIKWLESLLKLALADSKETIGAIPVCETICRRYADYLQYFEASSLPAPPLDDTFFHGNTWHACYVHIQSLKRQLGKALTIEDERQQLQALHWQYRFLASLLAHTVVTEDIKMVEIDLSLAIRPLIQANSPADWLHAVVDFANQSGAKMTASLAQVAKLEQEQLLHLAQAFNQDDFIPIMSALFFYKLHPQKLFDELLHPEKLVSVKARLTVLYDFVEMLHQSIVQALSQQGSNVVQDYLFHGEELPQGIEIDIGYDWRDLIQSVVKSWRVNMMPVHESDSGMNDIYDLLRAYKYWFNPNRLIDATMILQQRLGKSDISLATDGVFHQQMVARYHQLTTTECLDLYGYFANKDSSYLMRTLLAITCGAALSWLPILTCAELRALVHVYDSLECVMNALRDELAVRHINTAPYKRELSATEITPGRRNRNAVIRILSLYFKGGVEKNTKIEQLFKEVEALY